MPRLPQPGSDEGQWGNILNEFLAQVHNDDGSLKDNAVTASVLAPGAVNSAVLATGGGDGDVLVYSSGSANGVVWASPPSGSVTLSGDVNGAINANTLADGVVTGNKLSDGSVSAAKLSVSGTPATNNVLAWDGSSLVWASPSTTTTSLGDLADVDTTGATSGNVLGFNGTSWVPATGGGGGGLSYNFTTVTSDTTASAGDVVLANGTAILLVTLPAPVAGGRVIVKSLQTETVEVAPPSGAFIDASTEGSTTITSQFGSVTFISDGNNWYRAD